MRIVNLLVTATIFGSIVIGVMAASAVATGVVHAYLSPRPVPMFAAPD
jgi:hypothetical protein